MTCYYGYNVNSPAIQADFTQFMKTNPDLYSLVDWLKSNLNEDQLFDVPDDPEEMYELEELSKWAETHDYKYKPQIEDFPDEALENWAKENGFEKKNDNFSVESFLKENSGYQLTYTEGVFIIWDIYSHKDIFEAETMWELEDLIVKHYEEKKQKRIGDTRKFNEIIAQKKAEKPSGKRGRPKGSKNRAKAQ